MNLLYDQLMRAGWKYNAQSDCVVAPDRKTSLSMRTIEDIGRESDSVSHPPPDTPSYEPFKLLGGELFDVRQPSMSPPYNPYEKLAMRMNMGRDQSFGFDCMNIYEGPNTTFVFIVHNEKAIILEDPRDLFPSDRIVAQVRLLQE